jgi:hypothetical protein
MYSVQFAKVLVLQALSISRRTQTVRSVTKGLDRGTTSPTSSKIAHFADERWLGGEKLYWAAKRCEMNRDPDTSQSIWRDSPLVIRNPRPGGASGLSKAETRMLVWRTIGSVPRGPSEIEPCLPRGIDFRVSLFREEPVQPYAPTRNG